MSIRPGLCSVTFRALAPEDVVSLAVANGVREIEWGGDVHVPSGDTERATHVASLCAEAGLACPSFGSYVRAGTNGARQAFRAALETARALGAGNIRVWAGTVSGARTDAESWARVRGDLVEMADAAQRHGVTVSVEYHRDTLTEEAGDAVRLLVECDRPNLFTYWQPVPGRGLHAWLGELERLTPWLGYVHVFHWLPSPPRDTRRPLSEGAGDWTELLRAWRPATGWPHRRTAFLEFVTNDDPAAFAEDMRVLRHLITESAHQDAGP